MAIDLKNQKPETIEELNTNVKDIAEVVMHKQAVNIDTSSISTVFTDPDTEALRKKVLELINNLKNT